MRAVLLAIALLSGLAGWPDAASLGAVHGDVSWYDPPSSYQVSWAAVIGRFESWGRLHGIPYDPAHPYCAMRDFPIGSLVEIRWKGKTARCYVVDYGPDAGVFPERVLDASVEVFEQMAPRGRGVLHGAAVFLLSTEHCGPARTAAAPRRIRSSGWGRLPYLPY